MQNTSGIEAPKVFSFPGIMNFADMRRVRSKRTGEDTDMRRDLGSVDLTVFAKDYPEVRLVVEVKRSLSDTRHLDMSVKQVASYMWGANCHFGLVFTPATTFVLRDDFTTHGPESIRVTDAIPTAKLLSRLGTAAPETLSGQELEMVVQKWIELLANSYEKALPDDPEITKAFFPDIVGAVSEGRVVAEASFR
jgi:hypothetical protein